VSCCNCEGAGYHEGKCKEWARWPWRGVSEVTVYVSPLTARAHITSAPAPESPPTYATLHTAFASEPARYR